MNYLLAGETWVPQGDSRFFIEKWVPLESLWLEMEHEGMLNGNRPWGTPPYYRVYKLDGTELMDTPDWSHVVGFLQAVLGEEEVPHDFAVPNGDMRPFDRIWCTGGSWLPSKDFIHVEE